MLESTSNTQWILIGVLIFGGLIGGFLFRSQQRHLLASISFGHFYGAAASVALVLGMMQKNPESGIAILGIYPLFTTIGMIINGLNYRNKQIKKQKR